MALLILLLLLVAGGVLVAFKRSSKQGPLENNPMRGTTRRGK